MRLDKFLQVSRLIKRRTVANSICSRGRVLVNGHPAKAGKELSVGDLLSIDFGEEEPAVYEVLEVPAGNVPRGRSSTLYQRVNESEDSE